MFRSILLAIALVATLATGAAPLAAEQAVQAEDPGVKHMIAPLEKWSPDNPYAKQLPEARKAAADTLAKLQSLLQKDPFNFDAQINAYYAYVRAETRVTVLRDLAQQWERKNKQGQVTGQVLSLANLDYWPMAKEADAPQAQGAEAGDPAERMIAPDILRKATPVAGAKLTLRPRMIWIAAKQEGVKATDATTTMATPPTDSTPPADIAIYPPPPGRSVTFTAKSGKDGKFEFAKAIPADTYTLTVEAQGYETWWGTLVVPATGKANRTVYLSKFRVLMGTVSTIPLVAYKELQAGERASLSNSAQAPKIVAPIQRKLRPVAGAEVTLSFVPIVYRTADGSVAPGAIPPMFTYKTNDKGGYRFNNVKAGRYQMRVMKDGLRYFEAAVTVSQTLQRQDVVLLPEFEIGVPVEPRKKPIRIEKPMDAPAGTSLDKPFEQ